MSEALLAGTLCLMGCYVEEPRTEFGRKIAENLRALADAPDCSPEFCTICARLSARWERIAGGPPSRDPVVSPRVH